MLLLMAIHFHSNQLSAVCDLVCSTLGMKIPIRPHNLSRIKTIFVQEIFTEQVNHLLYFCNWIVIQIFSLRLSLLMPWKCPWLRISQGKPQDFCQCTASISFWKAGHSQNTECLSKIGFTGKSATVNRHSTQCFQPWWRCMSALFWFQLPKLISKLLQLTNLSWRTKSKPYLTHQPFSTFFLLSQIIGEETCRKLILNDNMQNGLN